MAKYTNHIFICTNQRPADNPRGSCDPSGIGALQVAFKKELAARGLHAELRANKSGCLDQCEHGPVVVIYPEAVWYGGVGPEDIPEIIETHLIGGRPVERLILGEECINTASCPHRNNV
ncbi:MAG: (2Fe-2S) ferredoxin domain-containing protein [Acidobacteriota bacterium]|jgi:(2Fe-2S) ferredoxin